MPCYQAAEWPPGEVTGPCAIYFTDPNPGSGKPRNAYFFAQGVVSNTPEPNPDPNHFQQQATLEVGKTLRGTSTGCGRKTDGGQEVLFVKYLSGDDLKWLKITPCNISPWA